MKAGFLQKHIHFFLLCGIILFVTFIYRFPDVYAYFATPSGMVFLGQNSWFDPQDINIYSSVIHYAQSGHLLLPNLWTALPNKPILIFPIEQLLGYFFRGIPPVFLFWIASIISGMLLIVGMYKLIRRYIASDWLVAFTTLGISLGGGFGMLLYATSIPSADIANGITFYETFFKPHEAISILCYLYGVLGFYDIFIRDEYRSTKNKMLLSLALTISFLLYPYLIASYLVITISFLVFVKKQLPVKELALVLLLPSAAVASVAYQLWQNPGFYAPFLQHLSTDPVATFFGYGLLLPFILYQLFFMKKTLFEKYLSWWLVSTLVLAFLPFGPGKIFLRGFFFPLVLLCVLQLQVLLKNLSRSFQILIWGASFSFICLTSLFIFYLRMSVPQTLDAIGVMYLPQDQYAVFSYLATHVPSGSGVLAGGIMSNLLPVYTDDRAVIGSLWSLNDTYYGQLHAVELFYAGIPPNKNYLKQQNISYVLWGPDEQKMTEASVRGNVTDLHKLYHTVRLVYETDAIKLYKVE